MKVYPLITVSCLLMSCSQTNKGETIERISETKFKIYTDSSHLKNKYIGFDSPKAINTIASVENEYFNAYNNGSTSRYFGSQWKPQQQKREIDSTRSNWKVYLDKLKKLKKTPEMMHCTLYGMKALKAGLGTNLKRLDSLHLKHYKNRDYAGWSVGYILVKYFNWKAYVIVQENSEEYKRCLNYYKKKKEYYVWKQPNIPIENLFIIDKDDDEITQLLKQNEFGWGFSFQGWHTWITRFNTLKECNWMGSPDANIQPGMFLFEDTPFLEYFDYQSHVVVFPPKE